MIAIKCPLSFADAWTIAAEAVHGKTMAECYCSVCPDVRQALMALDVASREQAVERERALVEAARPYLGAKLGWLPGVGSVRSVGVNEREHRALWDAVAAYGPIDPGAVAPAPASVSEDK